MKVFGKKEERSFLAFLEEDFSLELPLCRCLEEKCVMMLLYFKRSTVAWNWFKEHERRQDNSTPE